MYQTLNRISPGRSADIAKRIIMAAAALTALFSLALVLDHATHCHDDDCPIAVLVSRFICLETGPGLIMVIVLIRLLANARVSPPGDMVSMNIAARAPPR